MAKMRANRSVGDLQGTVGGLVYVHRADGTVVVRRAAERKADFSEAQEAQQSLFAQGQLFVRRLKADPAQYQPYQQAARVSRKRACDLAISDALCPPVIHDIDLAQYNGQAGGVIRVEAVDNFAVDSVRLSLSLLAGALVEEGLAVLDVRAARWIYVTQATLAPGTVVVLQVTALDRPGNAATKTLQHVLTAA